MTTRRDLLTAPLLTAPFWLSLLGRPALAAPEVLKFRDLYLRGRALTPRAQGLQGQEVEMVGYMAPPLKPEINFFVLTRLPMSVCLAAARRFSQRAVSGTQKTLTSL